MKKIRIVIAAALILFICFGWISQLKNGIRFTREYNNLISEAEHCFAQNLYQKAAMIYENALDMKKTESLCQKWIETCKVSYESSDITEAEYIKALNKACELYPKQSDYWESLINLSIQKKNFKQAKKYYNNAVNYGAKSERLTELKDIIFYSYTESSNVFNEIFMSSDGYATLCKNNQWGIMDPSGNWVYECTYPYLSPITKDKMVLTISERGTRICDGSKVDQAIIADVVERAKLCSDGIIPLCSDNTWEFYDIGQSGYILDQYEGVTAFSNGIAAVMKDGKWRLIDRSGEMVSNTVFDNIVTLGSGEYIYDGIMIASSNDKYRMYDAKGSEINSFEAAYMDFYLGGPIAFKSDTEKWGYVDSKGNIVIEPQYEEAKSFSNGLAAVKVNGTWGFINTTGKLVIDNKFQDTYYFTKNGKCFVSMVEGEYYMLSLYFTDGL